MTLIPTHIPDTSRLLMTLAEYEAARVETAAPIAAERDRLKDELVAVTEQLMQANATIAAQQQTLAANEQVYAEALRRNEGLLKTNREQAARIAELEALDSTPVVVIDPDPVVVPAVERHPVFPFTGLYIEDPRLNDSVNDVKQAEMHFIALRPALEFAAATGLMEDYIVHCNIIDLKHGAIPKEIARLNKRWWLSPVQASMQPGTGTQQPLIDHLKAARDAGCYGAVIDDAHNLTPERMTLLLNLITHYMPDAPVIASFGATFDDSAYPRSRYYDCRQWFLSQREQPGVWFTQWEAAQDAEIYAADVYRRGSGFMHPPERVREMFDIALPHVNGIAFYSMLNKETDHRSDHLKAKAANPDAVTVWDVMVACTAKYLAEWETRTIEVSNG